MHKIQIGSRWIGDVLLAQTTGRDVATVRQAKQRFDDFRDSTYKVNNSC